LRGCHGSGPEAARILQKAPGLINLAHGGKRVCPDTGEAEVPLYHFEVRTETHVMLTEGAQLEDSTAARIEAARRIGDLLKEHAGQFWVDQDWQMDITDERGLILYVIHVSAMKAAAMDGRP
jgi:GTP cyclohydrolase II